MDKTRSAVIDANVIIAYSFPQDNLHQKALKLVKEVNDLKKELNPLLVSEIATVLLQKTKNQTLVNKLTHDLLTDRLPGVYLNQLSGKILAQTLKIFQHQKSGQLSFADASIVAQAQLEKIPIIITFDKDIRQEFKNQFQFLPTRL